MRIVYIILILLSATAAFSQANKPERSNSITQTSIVDSVTSKKQDSLTYATLYFYRSFIPKMNAPIKKVPIFINDTLIHRLKANTVMSLKLFKEGKYSIRIDEKGESIIPVTIKFGKEYFFKCEVVAGLWFGKPTIEAVTPKIGRSELGKLDTEQASNPVR